MNTRHMLSVALLCAGLAVAGCGGDEVDDEASEASAAAATEGEVACEPVNPDLESEAGETVEVTLREYEFDPPAIEVEAGTVTFATTNAGGAVHEFAVLPGGGDVPFVEPGVPDEEALEAAGAFEMEGYGPGQDCNATWELEPGDYTLFCIIDAGDGETHYEKGMEGTLTVTG